MAKTLIDVNEQYLAAAREVLHTETKKDTVNAALRGWRRWPRGGGTCGGWLRVACRTWRMRR